MARTPTSVSDRMVDELQERTGLYGVELAAWLDKASAHFSKVCGRRAYVTWLVDSEWSVIWRQNVGVGECVENVVRFTVEELTDSPSVIDARIRECIAYFE